MKVAELLLLNETTCRRRVYGSAFETFCHDRLHDRRGSVKKRRFFSTTSASELRNCFRMDDLNALVLFYYAGFHNHADDPALTSQVHPFTGFVSHVICF